MTRHEPQLRLLSIAMAAQAGFVDALGFLFLGGFFVSFMSGNSTQMAVEATRHGAVAAKLALLIGLFVCGVMAGTAWRRVALPKPITRVQGLVTLLLVAAAVAQGAAVDRLAIGLMAFAMGAENAAFERDGEVSIGVTYVTGALVKMGQQLVLALTGGDRTAWIWQALLWAGLAVGAALGALAYARWGLASVACAAAGAAVLTGVALGVERSVPADASR